MIICAGMTSTFSIDREHTEDEEMCAQNLYSAIRNLLQQLFIYSKFEVATHQLNLFIVLKKGKLD
jgi:hypothetical protein